jgi:Uma2 family endonuclease
MSLSTRVSVDDYLKITDKPYREYRDGIVTAKPFPNKSRSLIMIALTHLLHQQGANAYPSLTLRLSRTKFLIPDIAVANDFPGDYPTEPVLLCCEILAPGDHIETTLAKCEEFHAWGVPHCWVIDPVKRSAWQYHREAEPTKVESTLSAGRLSVNLPELFAAIS